jgi:tetratricopeptide (TPR) repeat protein
MPSFPQYHCELAISESTQARLLWATGDREDAERLTHRAVARLERLAAETPSEPRYRDELAKSDMQMAQFWAKTQPLGCEKALLQAIALLEKLAADAPSVPQFRSSLAAAHGRLGLVLRDMGRPADARRNYQRAIALGEKLVSKSPSVPEYMYALASSLEYFAQLGGATNGSTEIERLYRRAIELEEKLAADSPSVPAYRQRLAMTHNDLGLFFADCAAQRHSDYQRRTVPGNVAIDFASGDHRNEAEKLYRRAITLFEGLSAEFPSAIAYQGSLAGDRTDLGLLLERTGRLAEAQEVYRSVVSMAEKSPTDLSSSPEFQYALGTSYLALAEVMQQAGRSIEAEQLSRRGITILKELEEADPRNDLAWVLSTGPLPGLRDPRLALKLARQVLEQRPQAGVHWTTLGVAHYRICDWSAAIEALEKAVQLDSGGEPTGWFFLAMACWQKGDKEKARPWFDKAVQWMEKNPLYDEELRRFRSEAAALLGVADPPKSTGKEEETPKQHSRR